jgi:antitoxin FitA
MGDMLIRGIDPELKRRLEESARRNGRSLSQEAIALIQRSIAVESATTQKAGDRLRSLIGNVQFTDDEITSIASSRQEPDRAPPDFRHR